MVRVHRRDAEGDEEEHGGGETGQVVVPAAARHGPQISGQFCVITREIAVAGL